jgi:hypothetical protein
MVIVCSAAPFRVADPGVAFTERGRCRHGDR